MVIKEERRKPGITVVIPCYNYGHFITDTLTSLQEQSFTNWECWVVDDGSSDATAEVVKIMTDQDRRINYIYQPNQGQPAARNRGLQQANGDLIQFLDADDLLEPMKFSRQLEYLDRHPDTDVVYGEVRYFESDRPDVLFPNRWGNRAEHWMPKISGRGAPLIEAFIDRNIFELGCALFRKKATDRIGSFNTGLQGLEDYEYCFRGAVKGLLFNCLEEKGTRVLMRHHAESYSKSLFLMYKKELLFRGLVDEQLGSIKNRKLKALNQSKYAWRLRRLHDLVIDQARKGKKTNLNRRELQWICLHSNLKQNLYFFPRIIKALAKF